MVQPLDTYGLTGRLWKLYVNNCTRFVMCSDGKVWMPKKAEEPLHLTMRIMAGHVNGRYNVGVFGGKRSAKFLCFDVDYMDGGLVLRLIDQLVRLGFEREDIHPSLSGGKGYHVEIFFDKPVANWALRKIYDCVIERGGFDPHKVEFRPTENQSVRLPLSEHYKTGNTSWYCDVDTLAPIRNASYIYDIIQVPRERVCEIVDRIGGRRKPKARVKKVDVMEDGMPVMTEAGQRHGMMVRIATWRRSCGDGEDQIYEVLMGWVAKQDRGLINSTDEEIAADAEKIAKWAGN